MALCTLLAALLLAAPVPTSLRAGTASGMTIDGVFDEDAWASAEVATDFTQFRPEEGEPATQRTEVRVLIGPDAVYVGATMYDSDPDGIRTTLGRRDQPDGDFFLVGIDSYGDARTAFEFAVSASGVQFDAINTGGNEDESWDAVWTSATRVTAEGWTAELEIPLSQLRFTGEEETWGVNFVRMVRRLEEQSFWVPLTRERENSFLEDFARLEGVEGVRPRRVVQALPYSLARTNRSEAVTPGAARYDVGSELGADVKLGLASNLILDLTLNPDFGQVEADPAELNLSTFETFFSERRPFFLEGTDIFDLTYASGDGALLYTRRIGAASPLIGAAKMTGRTAGGLNVGALAAATGTDFDPTRAYGAVRVKQELPRQSYVGLGATGYATWAGDADLASGAVAADWAFRLFEARDWQLEGTAASTLRDPGPGLEADLGYAVYVGFDRVQGFFTPGFGVRVYSDDFRLNDVGRFRQTDLISLRAGTSQLWNRGDPVGPYRRLQSRVFGTQEWRYVDGTNRGFRASGYTGGQLLNFWELGGGVEVFGLGGFDVRETRGLGPVVNVPGASAYVEVGTDQRKTLWGFGFLGVSAYEDGGATVSPSLYVNWIASDRLTLSLDADLASGADERAWVLNEGFVPVPGGLGVGLEAGRPGDLDPAAAVPLGLSPEAVEALFGGVDPVLDADGLPLGYYRPVFARRDTRTASLTGRANVLFSPTLSLQLYGQLFSARGRYDGFQLLAGPDDLRPFDYPRRRDFATSSFRSNAVLRWEYRPGSTLFVVWSQSRGADVFEDLVLDGPRGPSPFETSTTRQFADTFEAFPNDVLLVKLNYLIMR